jgi:hypothetical protein
MEYNSNPNPNGVGCALLCQDQRIFTLFPKNHRVRDPERRYYFATAEEAYGAINIDHSALLDALCKIRASETLLGRLAKETTDPQTRDVLIDLVLRHQDMTSTIEYMLERKAEAELWLEDIE